MVATTAAASFGPILRTIFPAKKMMEIGERVDPLIGVISKKTDFEGSYVQVPVQYVLNQAIGATFATAQAVTGGSKFKEFDITRAKYYGFAFLERELLEASASNKAAFLNGLKTSINATMANVTKELGRQLYGNKGGARGQISSVATTRIVLVDRRDAAHFFPGMVINTSTTDGTSGAIEAGSHVVSAVDRVNGYVDAATNWSTGIATIAANQYLFRAGDFGACISGLGGWVPATDPTSGDSFFGVDRSTAVDELSGIRVTSTATTVEDAIQDALSEASWRGARSLDYGFLHTARWHELAKEAGSRVTRDDSVKSKEAGFGYKALSVVGPDGEVKLLPSVYCPYNSAFFIESEHCALHGLGTMPDLIKDPGDGKYIHRVYNADQYEIRLGFMGNFYTMRPNGLVRLTFA
jgi:hypothetical protein